MNKKYQTAYLIGAIITASIISYMMNSANKKWKKEEDELIAKSTKDIVENAFPTRINFVEEV